MTELEVLSAERTTLVKFFCTGCHKAKNCSVFFFRFVTLLAWFGSLKMGLCFAWKLPTKDTAKTGILDIDQDSSLWPKLFLNLAPGYGGMSRWTGKWNRCLGRPWCLLVIRLQFGCPESTCFCACCWVPSSRFPYQLISMELSMTMDTRWWRFMNMCPSCVLFLLSLGLLTQ